MKFTSSSRKSKCVARISKRAGKRERFIVERNVVVIIFDSLIYSIFF